MSDREWPGGRVRISPQAAESRAEAARGTLMGRTSRSSILLGKSQLGCLGLSASTMPGAHPAAFQVGAEVATEVLPAEWERD